MAGEGVAMQHIGGNHVQTQHHAQSERHGQASVPQLHASTHDQVGLGVTVAAISRSQVEGAQMMQMPTMQTRLQVASVACSLLVMLILGAAGVA
eukprot:5192591-Pleurochrysis_carterae.AAC.1